MLTTNGCNTRSGSESNPGLANLMLEQFGGPQGELAAACRYFTQALAEDDPGRKDMLMDIATEELSHLEVIGTIVAMLNKGAKGRLAEAAESEAELYRSITGNGNTSHVTQILYGGGPALTNSGGQLWNAGYIDSIGDPTADLRSNIAAEARAKIVYERLINVTDDPGRQGRARIPDDARDRAPAVVREGALLDRARISRPASCRGIRASRTSTSTCRRAMATPAVRGIRKRRSSLSAAPMRSSRSTATAKAAVSLTRTEQEVLEQLAVRTASDPESDPLTGAELGMGLEERRDRDAAAVMGRLPGCDPAASSARGACLAREQDALQHPGVQGDDDDRGRPQQRACRAPEGEGAEVPAPRREQQERHDREGQLQAQDHLAEDEERIGAGAAVPGDGDHRGDDRDAAGEERARRPATCGCRGSPP